jgi:hypothetical protein
VQQAPCQACGGALSCVSMRLISPHKGRSCAAQRMCTCANHVAQRSEDVATNSINQCAAMCSPNVGLISCWWPYCCAEAVTAWLVPVVAVAQTVVRTLLWLPAIYCISVVPLRQMSGVALPVLTFLAFSARSSTLRSLSPACWLGAHGCVVLLADCCCLFC